MSQYKYLNILTVNQLEKQNFLRCFLKITFCALKTPGIKIPIWRSNFKKSFYCACFLLVWRPLRGWALVQLICRFKPFSPRGVHLENDVMAFIKDLVFSRLLFLKWGRRGPAQIFCSWSLMRHTCEPVHYRPTQTRMQILWLSLSHRTTAPHVFLCRI